jgi:lipopolysaccharide/colanic/teichoic acid biosynthesis glycosyltransferase
MNKLLPEAPENFAEHRASPISVPKQAGLTLLLKRSLDLCSAAIALCLFSPLTVIVAALIRATMGGPVLFRHLRPGRYGRPFMLIKFRTMSDRKDQSGKLLPDGERLTSVGRFLRSTSLDELPQFINVLRGDMSLVGPRPLCMQYLERYSQRQARRHEVMPGITGWAQVNGRNALSWEQKFELDVYYVDHWSLGLDLKILWMTALKVLRREGISERGHATMTEFMGAKAHFTEDNGEHVEEMGI